MRFENHCLAHLKAEPHPLHYPHNDPCSTPLSQGIQRPPFSSQPCEGKRGRVVLSSGGAERPGDCLLLPHPAAEPELEDWPPGSHPLLPGIAHTCSAPMRHLEARPWALEEQAHHHLASGTPCSLRQVRMALSPDASPCTEPHHCPQAQGTPWREETGSPPPHLSSSRSRRCGECWERKSGRGGPLPTKYGKHSEQRTIFLSTWDVPVMVTATPRVLFWLELPWPKLLLREAGLGTVCSLWRSSS